MPDGKTHKLVGTATGALYAAYRAREQRTADRWLEVLGGALGGYLGGILPDSIEPATSSWHRDLAHSCAAGGGIVALSRTFTALAEACREQAEKCRAIPMVAQGNFYVVAPADPWKQFIMSLSELIWRFLAGCVNGLAAGYTSHLALDAVTPRSIPLLTTGF